MLRVLLMVAVTMMVASAAFLTLRTEEETAGAPETTTPSRQPLRTEAGENQPATTGTEPSDTLACAPPEVRETTGRTRIGSFEAPEKVPEYEVAEEQPAGGDGTCAVRLLVDTQSRSKADYALITQDLKVRYTDYDAASVEFVDLSATLEYLGGALIFNTTEGASFLGYTRYLPNSDGYVVSAAD